ncbi:hypothetical protein P262_03798 [Cronobacter malonaticus]|uniref:Uncharacterized protein n=1 Tax=Cronobacter malonaticus TaxID=413503 RepID=V5U0P9_9ENTR|nr:hypothetical protein P262_03798 [Cronobacter malonaticus]CCJ96068.1 hypothetical protein BN131_3741 [Cronobacter malonaticus 681]
MIYNDKESLLLMIKIKCDSITHFLFVIISPNNYAAKIDLLFGK